MSVAYVGHSQAKDGAAETLREFFVSVVKPALRASPGCESCTLLQSDVDPSSFITIEVWDSIESHRASVKNIPKESIAEFMRLVAVPPRGGYHRIL